MDKHNTILSNVICQNILKQAKAAINAKENKPLTLEEIRKKLTVYDKKSEQVEEYLDSLQEVVGSVVSVTASNKVVAELDSHLKILYSLTEDINNLTSILKSIQALGDEKENAAYLKEAKTLLAKYKKNYAEAEKLLLKLSKTKRPSVLSTQKNDKLDELVSWMDSKIESYNESVDDGNEVTFDLDESLYMIEPSATNQNAIRCVRFIPLENLPLADGGTTNLYAMFEVDLLSPVIKNKLYSSQRVSPIYFRFVSKVATPNKLAVPYAVSSIRDFANLVEQLAEKAKLKIFGFEPTWAKNTENRREKLGINLPVLKDKSIKITCDGPIVTFIFPRKYASKITPNKYNSEDMRAIIKDIARFTGQKLAKNFDNLEEITKGIRFKKHKSGAVSIVVRIPANHAPLNPRKEAQPKPKEQPSTVDILTPLTPEKEPVKKTLPKPKDSMDRRVDFLQEITEDDANSYSDLLDSLNDDLRSIPGMDD